MKLGVIDYKAGNLKSVENALRFLGADILVSSDPDRLFAADKLIFPGVGHAKSAMNRLSETGLSEMLTSYISKGNPLLGICLGSQILLESSEEGETSCLGIIKGRSKVFESAHLKVPQIGWNTVTPVSPHPIFRGIEKCAHFYFVHSYYTAPAEPANVLCTTEYGQSFASGLVKDNVCAVQFHPERSGEAGLKMLDNFIKAG